MPKYKLVYKKPATRAIQRLSPQIKKRLKLKLEFFVNQDDSLIFTKQLTKPADVQYRYRVGNYRILFDFKEETIVILYVQHRRDVYKK